ncbi:MAG: GHKL domain-containing protein [Lachnospiraceae bacterium]|nr:GHKL domain-containing protein [Lachnospiraceae bacterium]
MDWLSQAISDGLPYIRWYTVIPALLGYMVVPLIVFRFFCQYAEAPFKWRHGIFYMVFSAGFSVLELGLQLPGSIGLFGETLLLIFCGRAFSKKSWMEASAVSVLLLSVLNVSNSMIRWLDHRIIAPVILSHNIFVIPSDTIRESLRIFIVSCILIAILKRFRESIRYTNRQALLQLTVPVFFISLVGRMIQDSIYGKGEAAIWDPRTGEVEILPNININYWELFFIQVFSCLCFFSILFAYHKITGILQTEQKLRLLEQQAKQQRQYLQEAKMREQKTRSFRHDIKNHLAVLAGLLKRGQTDEACRYLSCLEELSAELSYPVHTGEAAVDVLLGSKLSAAKEKKIRISCEVELPKIEGMTDLEWCIILSNALDNAVRACDEVSEEEKYIEINSRRKGNFYLLLVENSCSHKIQGVVKEGVGLSNIRSVVEKHQGIMETEVSRGRYKLNLLFVI